MKKNYTKLALFGAFFASIFFGSAQTDAEVIPRLQPTDSNLTIANQKNNNGVIKKAATCTNELTTDLLAGNSYDGNLFDITATNDVTIETFTVSVDQASTIEIWVRSGSYVGYELDGTGWTLLGSGSVSGVGAGASEEVPVNIHHIMYAGETYGFYVVNADATAGFNYTNGTAVGNVLSSDANITIYEGNGSQYPWASTFSPRNFNGSVIYCDGALSTNELSTSKVSLYPNPAENELNIELPFSHKYVSVSIYNVIGERVLFEEINATQTNKINISELNAGVYFVKVQGDNIDFSQKFTVK